MAHTFKFNSVKLCRKFEQFYDLDAIEQCPETKALVVINSLSVNDTLSLKILNSAGYNRGVVNLITRKMFTRLDPEELKGLDPTKPDLILPHVKQGRVARYDEVWILKWQKTVKKQPRQPVSADPKPLKLPDVSRVAETDTARLDRLEKKFDLLLAELKKTKK